MSPLTYRKTLLALAIAACALPAHGQTVQLTDAGFTSSHQSYANGLEFGGSFTNISRSAIVLDDATVQGGLTFNSPVNDNDRTTVDMVNRSDALTLRNSQVTGDLVNQAFVRSTSLDGNALKISNTTLDGNLINQGTLQAGTGIGIINRREAYGINLASATGQSTLIKGDVVNAQNAKVRAYGYNAITLNLAGATVQGKIINRGAIESSGPNAISVNATSRGGATGMPTRLDSIENHGNIVASDTNSQAIALDGATLTTSLGRHIDNRGSIYALSGTGIRIGDVAYDAPGQQPWYRDHGDLNIFNSGIIMAQVAIDASHSNRPVELILREGSQITGMLDGLSNIEVEGDSEFQAHYLPHSTPDIRLKPDGWIEVGNLSDDTRATLSLTAARTVIDGNLSVAGNSALGLELSSETDPSVAVLKVSGTSKFEQGSRIALHADEEDFQPSGSRYLLVEAGQVQLVDTAGHDLDPNGIQVTSTSALLRVQSSAVEDNKIYAQVTTKPVDEITEIVKEGGGNGNAQGAIGNAINNDLLAQLPKGDPLLAYAATADQAQVARLAHQLTPEVNGGARQAATGSQRMIGNAISSRASSLRGASSGEGFSQAGVWIQSLYSDATQNNRDGVAGYNAYSRGIAVGADGKLNDQLTLGLAYSFLDTDVNGSSGNKTSVESHAFTLYSAYTLGNYFVDASLTYGLGDNEGKREIADTRAKADYDSNQLAVNLVGGYTWHINPQLLVEPRVAARYSRVDIDGYREKGSSAALKVEDERYEALELGAGVRVAGSYAIGVGTLEPQFKLMGYHDFAADQTNSTSTFLLGNTPFVTRGASAVRNSYEAGIGADYKLGAVTLGVNYDYVGKSGFNADVFSAKVRYDF
ncbi:TPA: autotransporter domain-containing protein [Pseudomonas putida]|nr:autotransporter domain-containing protein [Pseudomonas putida]